MRLRRLGIKSLAWLAALCGFAALPNKAAAAKVHPLRVQNGILTVDGLTVRTAVNLHVADFHYLYIYVPGSGTAVISDQPFAGAREQKAAFHGNSMTILAGDRRVQLTAANRFHGTRAAFVRFERGVGPKLRVPAVSYGDAALLPAVWPSDEASPRLSRVHVKVKNRRGMRSGRLCRPSPHGRELCATVHEVAYSPY